LSSAGSGRRKGFFSRLEVLLELCSPEIALHSPEGMGREE
jgi:hypothetical protein